MWVGSSDAPTEITIRQLLERVRPGDLFVINDTRVLPRRIVSEEGLEILFLAERSPQIWEVLCPARRWPSAGLVRLPGGQNLRLIQSGRPQLVQVEGSLQESDFEAQGQMPLPPYIQKARAERRERAEDRTDYQTAWASRPGSLAAPTASLHFSQDDLEFLRSRGVQVGVLTLHVGLGTFLPIETQEVQAHKMHAEWAEIPAPLVQSLEQRQRESKSASRVWALGTTVARALESWAAGRLPKTESGSASGWTDLYITPGHRFALVDCLLTNFHQPKSTLLALVGAFAGLERVKSCYAWAVEKEFRLFSYGDLSVWSRS
jgi:S-adenosylmethionine:tRNA ribosyltransferase-isomerase